MKSRMILYLMVFFLLVLNANAITFNVKENFEGAGTPSGWSGGSGANCAGALVTDFDSTVAPIRGAQSVRLDNAVAFECAFPSWNVGTYNTANWSFMFETNVSTVGTDFMGINYGYGSARFRDSPTRVVIDNDASESGTVANINKNEIYILVIDYIYTGSRSLNVSVYNYTSGTLNFMGRLNFAAGTANSYQGLVTIAGDYKGDSFCVWNWTQGTGTTSGFNQAMYEDCAGISTSIGTTLNLSATNPSSGFALNVSSVYLNINFTANHTYNFTTLLYIDNILNQTNKTSITGGSNTLVNFSITGLRDGAHTYNISAYDNTTWVNVSAMTFYVDSINLNPTTMEPFNNSNYTSQTIKFRLFGESSYNRTCSLYINDSFFTSFSGPAGLIGYGDDLVMSSGGMKRYYWNCTTDYGSEKSIENVFYLDYVFPSLSTTLVNKSAYYRRNIIADFNFTDDLSLYTVNITLEDGTILHNKTSILTPTYNYALNFNASNMSSGNHTLFVYWADGHTANEIPEYEVKKPLLFSDKLTYQFDKENYVSVQADSILDSLSTKKQIDRYTFDYKPWNTKSESYSFIVESSEYIDIVNAPNTPWKTWLITNGKWIDFANLQGWDVEYKRQSDNKVIATVNKGHLSSEKISFSSIGDLNIKNATYTFYVLNSSIAFDTPVLQSETVDFSLTVNNSYSTINVTSFVWNGTTKSTRQINSRSFNNLTGYTTIGTSFVTPFKSQQYTANFTWSFYINASGVLEYDTISGDQVVLNVGIDNCSTYSMIAVNFSVINSTSLNVINTTASGWYAISFNNLSYRKEMNITYGWTNVPAICIYPNYTSLNISGQTEFILGASTNTHYFVNASIGNVSSLVPLYWDDGYSQVQFRVVNQDDTPVSDVYISILDYDFATNSYALSQILKTDSDGYDIGNIVLINNWYKFILYQDNNVVLVTEPMKLTSATKIFRIADLGSNYYNFVDEYSSTYHTLIYNNATGNFVFTWDNPAGTALTACLNVIRRSTVADTVVNNTCTDGISGTIIVNINNSLPYLYIAKGTLSGSPTFLTDILSVSFDDGYRKFGQDGIFLTFLVRVSLAMVGIWNPIVAIFLMVMGDIVMMILGLYHMSWEIMITYILLAAITIWRLNKR